MKFEWVYQTGSLYTEVVYTKLLYKLKGLKKQSLRPNWVGFTNDEFYTLMRAFIVEKSARSVEQEKLIQWVYQCCLPALAVPRKETDASS